MKKCEIKRIMFWLGIVVSIIQVCACIAMGFEIFIATHMNPDAIIIEGYIMGVCLIIEIVCGLYRAYSSKQ
ncbi:MAG: hypothetical protein NC394_06690 [Bacteroides sp.]|nr:hypothetical protein [Bacteroides sp.]MCM1236326.1 hypothetical protein [Ruminococcus flavefaciens]